uniref:Uncharacterized protein n=1 Tax=Rangifer tarandus platyrhynchus TaxID=3082113 RepID=A0ACB0DPN7_RANTA|nr:unnamed protein product [Rangifer tarandus platyrhynchus]
MGLWGQHERAAQKREGNPGALTRRGMETGLEAGQSPKGEPGLSAHGAGPVPCKRSSCAGKSLMTTAGMGGGHAGDGAPVCRRLETGHSCQVRRRDSGGACLHHPRFLSSHWGQPTLSSHPGARSREGELLSTGPRPDLRLSSGVCPFRPTGVPLKLQEPTSEARPWGSQELGSRAVPPTGPPGSVFTLCGRSNPSSPLSQSKACAPGCSRPLGPQQPPHPQEQTGLGERPGPGPSWSLSCCP